MAEFCVDCWNKLNGEDEASENYVLSREMELCEGCGEWKHTIIRRRDFPFLYKLFHL